MIYKFFSLFALSAVLLVSGSHANNIRISDVSTISTLSTTQVKFDLAWDNCWRSPLANNWDAAWVFFKYKLPDGTWNHLDLTGDDISLPNNFTYKVPSDKKGIFIFRDQDGIGNVSLSGVRIGVQLMAGSFDLKVFGIEMVYIPEGIFYAGGFRVGNNNSLLIGPSLIQNVTLNTGYSDQQMSQPGIGISGPGGLDNDNNGVIDHPDFPTGYKSFYCMKYEITQGAYRDFLNTLTWQQQSDGGNLLAVSPDGPSGTNIFGVEITGNYIEIKTRGNQSIHPKLPAQFGCDANGNNLFDEPSDGEWTALNGISWMAFCAYLDWSALRPMTELEYQKVCRGPNAIVQSEYAWGTPYIYNQNLNGIYIKSINTINQSNENVLNGSIMLGNAVTAFNCLLTHRQSMPPFRVGIFATSSSNRISSGASYYGVLDMTGNVAEMVVSIGNMAGRTYRGICGNGFVSYSGADVPYWPGNHWSLWQPCEGSYVWCSTGSLLKGGSFINGTLGTNTAEFPTIDNRTYSPGVHIDTYTYDTYFSGSAEANGQGGRGVRSDE